MRWNLKTVAVFIQAKTSLVVFFGAQTMFFVKNLFCPTFC